jgi:protein TonB
MRYIIGIVAGSFVTLALFYFMSTLISGSKKQPDPNEMGSVVDFIRVKQEEQVKTRDRAKPKEPPPPKKPPQKPKLDVASQDKPQSQDLNMRTPKMADSLKGGMGPYLGGGGGGPSGDAEEMPIVRINPQWPQKARIRGIEGYVTVSFTITKTGSIRDVEVVDANPPRIFNRVVKKAVLRWKYKPKYVDGQPVERTQQVTLDFKLSED